jgi:hypothetical protein
MERYDGAPWPCGDDGIGARPIAADMRARLERHIDGRTLGAVAGAIERDRLRMRAASGRRPAAADDLARRRDHHCADGWIGPRRTEPASRK